LEAVKDSWNHDKEVYESRIRKARAPGLGVFAGLGYTGEEFKITVGIGYVLKVF
jgi:hypothetical protein